MKFALVANDDFSVWHFRKGLIKALVAHGHCVVVMCPEGPYVSKLAAIGARHVAVPFYRFVSARRDVGVLWRLYRTFRAERPDIVHNITVKPNIYGTLAARLARVPKVVNLVSGLGYGFLEPTTRRQAVLRSVLSFLYRLASGLSDCTWFQNTEDRDFFVHSKFLAANKAVVIPGSGVDTSEYSPTNVDRETTRRLRTEFALDDASAIVLMMVARVTWSKGVREFVEASKLASDWNLPVKFVLAGPLDPESPDPVPRSYLTASISPTFAWLGFRSDVREILSLADIVTLPSFYREGVPRVLLEGMAMGKPIVTTDNVGCRDVVEKGVNGFLVPTRDAEAFGDGIKSLVADRELRRTFGRRSRVKAEAEFEERKVVENVFTHLYGIEYRAVGDAYRADAA